MSNPFENTKEPRFTGAYIFDTPKNMFTKGADVYTYGIYGTGGGGGPTVPPGFSEVVTTGIATETTIEAVSSNIATVNLYSARCWAYVMRTSGGNRKVKVINVENGTQVLSIDVPDNGAPNDIFINRYGDCHAFILGGILYLVAMNVANDNTYNSNLYKLNSSYAWELVEANVLAPTAWNQFPSVTFGRNNVGNFTGLSGNNWWGIKVSGWSLSNPEYDEWQDPQFFKLASDGTKTTVNSPLPNYTGGLPYGFVVVGNHIYQYYDDTAWGNANQAIMKRAVYDISSGTPSLLLNENLGNIWDNNKVKALTLPSAQMSNGVIGAPAISDVSLSRSYDFKRYVYSAGSVAATDYPTITFTQQGAGEFVNSSSYVMNVAGWSLSETGSALLSVPTYEYGGTAWTRFFRLKSNLTTDSTLISGRVQCSSYDSISKRVWMLANPSDNSSPSPTIRYMTVGA